jgi:hypothetical protein
MRWMGDVMSRDEDGRKTRGVLSQGELTGARLLSKNHAESGRYGL